MTARKTPYTGSITVVRLPVAFREHLQACAVANYRSLSAEIRCRLEESCAGESINEHGVIVRGLPAGQK